VSHVRHHHDVVGEHTHGRHHDGHECHARHREEDQTAPVGVALEPHDDCGGKIAQGPADLDEHRRGEDRLPRREVDDDGHRGGDDAEPQQPFQAVAQECPRLLAEGGTDPASLSAIECD
jgi:hypothetical protein